jgi:hypothetical protein
LLCTSGTPTNGFAFSLVDVVKCMQSDDYVYEWFLNNFQPVVPFPVKCGDGFFAVEAELEWLDVAYPNGLPDGFWENITYG